MLGRPNFEFIRGRSPLVPVADCLWAQRAIGQLGVSKPLPISDSASARLRGWTGPMGPGTTYVAGGVAFALTHTNKYSVTGSVMEPRTLRFCL